MLDIPLFFRLPDAWLFCLLSEWLDMPSVGKLDTAISCKEYRPEFLLSLQCMRSTSADRFSYGLDEGTRFSTVRWCAGRWW